MNFTNWLLTALCLTSLGSVCAQNTLRPAQERAVLKLLRIYETNVNALVPRLVGNTGKAMPGVANFEKTLFVSSKTLIVNHVSVRNLQLDSLTTVPMQQEFLSAETFLQLCARVFTKNFTYKLNLGSAKVTGQRAPVNSAGKGVLTSSTAQVLVGVSLQGTNGALQINQTDSLRFLVEFTGTSSRNVVSARIISILKVKGSPTTTEEPVEPIEHTLVVKAKVDSLLYIIAGLASAKDTQAVQYRVYKGMLPQLMLPGGHYRIFLGTDSTERRILAKDLVRIDSLWQRKYKFEKALMAYVTFQDTTKISKVTMEYFYGTTFKGDEMNYQKNYEVTLDMDRTRFMHAGWWISEIWLREISAKKSRPIRKRNTSKN